MGKNEKSRSGISQRLLVDQFFSLDQYGSKFRLP